MAFPSIRISIGADVSRLGKDLKKGEGIVQSFGKFAGNTMLGVAGAAAGAAFAIGVQGVKAAIADEAAQSKLNKTLENVTGATKAQTKAVEDYITKTSMATGVSDDELRPSLERLARSTRDITEAQKLQKLALDISAGTGKDLMTVSNALGRAYDGNFKSLQKLGIPLDDNLKKSQALTSAKQRLSAATERAAAVGVAFGNKSKQHEASLKSVAAAQAQVNSLSKEGIDWQASLAKSFSGALDASLDTQAGKLKVLNTRWNEMQENIGYVLLEGLEPLMDWASGPEGQKFLNDFMLAFKDAAVAVAEALPGILETLKKVGEAAGGMGLDFKSFMSPEFLAAGAAFTLTPGPIPLKGLAAIAAYYSVKDSAKTSQDRAVDVQQARLLGTGFNESGGFYDGGGASSVNLIGNRYTKPQLAKMQSELKTLQEKAAFSHSVTVNGVLDPQQAAIAVQRALSQSARMKLGNINVNASTI